MTDDRATLLVDLALQGGGAHGAFTWRVLDRLLEEPWLRIEAISGTSAGANASVLPSVGIASLVGFGAVVAALPVIALLAVLLLGSFLGSF